MAANDEIFKLILDLGGSSTDAQALVDKLKDLGSAALGVKAGYDTLERQVGTYTVATSKLDEQLDKQVRAAHEATTAQKNLRMILDETATATVRVDTAATGAVGTKTGGGRGMLGFSYAFQDFVAVIGQGGENALPRAMGAIANNIDSMALAAGRTVPQAAALSLGFTALTAAMPLLVSGFKSAWESMAGGEAFETTKERLKEIKGEIEKTHQAWLGMMQAPTDHEKQAAEAAKSMLEDRNVGPKATEAVAVGMSDEEVAAGLEPDQRKDILSDKKIKDIARDQAFDAQGTFRPGEEEAATKRLRGERTLALAKFRRQVARKVVAGAGVAGPKGQVDRDTLLRLTKGVPGLEALQGATAGQMKADEEDSDAMEAQSAANVESGKQAGKNIRKGIAEEKRQTAQAKADNDDIAADVKRRQDETRDKVNATDVDERARSRAFILMQQGGAKDRRGRFHKMDPQQQAAANAQQTEVELRRRFPGMDQEGRHVAAVQTARDASAAVRDEVKQAQVGAIQAGFSTDQALYAALQTTLQRLKAEEAKANTLTRDIRAMQRDTIQTQQSAANLGRQ
jgi:hypothetical protein